MREWKSGISRNVRDACFKSVMDGYQIIEFEGVQDFPDRELTTENEQIAAIIDHLTMDFQQHSDPRTVQGVQPREIQRHSTDSFSNNDSIYFRAG